MELTILGLTRDVLLGAIYRRDTASMVSNELPTVAKELEPMVE